MRSRVTFVPFCLLSVVACPDQTIVGDAETGAEPIDGDGDGDPGDGDPGDGDGDPGDGDAECGNSLVESGEPCDDGNSSNTDACTNACEDAACGDGFLQPESGEECDTGPDNGRGSACTESCLFNVCGDGVLGPGEACDDGNDNDDDSCTTDCAFASCGDGVVEGREDCDDGNTDDSDSCLSTCVNASCGDSHVLADIEECDDGGLNGDSAACTSNCVAAYCGDALVHEGVEECDLGDQNGPGQLCLAGCMQNVCGDGDKSLAEGCDDGNLANDDGCSGSCALESCGDGVVQQGEECDDGDLDNTNGCTTSCLLPVCGDGWIQAGEECDDADPDAADECLPNCFDATCGDGQIWLGQEDCDDGNGDDDDDCLSDCETATCGDGIVWLGEEMCDDANQMNGDGCQTNCLTTPGLTVWQDSWLGITFSDVAANINDSVYATSPDGWCASWTALGVGPANCASEYEWHGIATDPSSGAFWLVGAGDTDTAWVHHYSGPNTLVWVYAHDQVSTLHAVVADPNTGETWSTGSPGTLHLDEAGNALQIVPPAVHYTSGRDIAKAGEHIYVAAIATTVPRHAIVIKYDLDLDEIWTRTFDEGAGSIGYDAPIGVDLDGNVWLSWMSSLNAVYYQRLAKLDPDGNTLLTQNLPIHTVRGLVYSPMKNEIVTSGYNHLGQSTAAYVRGHNIDTGAIAWTKTINAGSATADALAVDSQGYLLVGVNETLNNNADGILFRLTP